MSSEKYIFFSSSLASSLSPTLLVVSVILLISSWCVYMNVVNIFQTMISFDSLKKKIHNDFYIFARSVVVGSLTTRPSFCNIVVFELLQASESMRWERSGIPNKKRRLCFTVKCFRDDFSFNFFFVSLSLSLQKIIFLKRKTSAMESLNLRDLLKKTLEWKLKEIFNSRRKNIDE